LVSNINKPGIASISFPNVDRPFLPVLGMRPPRTHEQQTHTHEHKHWPLKCSG